MAPKAKPKGGGEKAKLLTERERRFVEAYMGEAAGNATKAAQLSGYGKNANTSHALGSRLLRKVTVARAIADRTAKDEESAIADRSERQRFYTKMMRATDQAAADRLKAAQILGRTQGDEIKRLVVEDPDKVLAELLGVDPSSLP